MSVSILVGDCRARMAEMPDNSIDSVVCDPPYHLTSIVKRFGSATAAPAKSNGATGVYGRASKGFMGQTWDGGDVAFDPETWAEVLRVLKPGGHLVAFSGTRTYHRMAVAIEDAGFEIRDQLAWVYGSGFPKSLDVSKAIDKARNGGSSDVLRCCAWIRERICSLGLSKRHLDEAAGTSDMGGWWTSTLPHRCAVPTLEQWQKLEPLLGVAPEWMQSLLLPARQPGEAWQEAEVIGECDKAKSTYATKNIGGKAEANVRELKAANSEAAQQWQGWGTALKPSWEPICLARKPLSEGSVAANVLKWGCGAVHIDACRISSPCNPDDEADGSSAGTSASHTASQRTRTPNTDQAASSEQEREHHKSPRANGSSNARPDPEALGFLSGYPACHRSGDEQPRPGEALAQGEAASDGGVHESRDPQQAGRDSPQSLSKPSAETINIDAQSKLGRWPANLCHDGSEEVLAGFPDLGATAGSYTRGVRAEGEWLHAKEAGTHQAGFGDSGSAARFFYCAKATTEERGEGNNHPTVKPIALMQWLVRLVTPKGGTVLDPFSGSGSTLIAADMEQMNAIGCELSPEYAAIAETRIRAAAGMFADVKIAA